MRPLRVKRLTSTMSFATLLLWLAVGGAGDAAAQELCGRDQGQCKMTIKIFNDDPNYYIFPVLTMGKHPKASAELGDIWLQANFKVPQNDVLKGNGYPIEKTYRIYINPGAGIAPNTGVILTLPLYTQLVAKPTATDPDQYIDWWSGGTIQLYVSNSKTPPAALTDALTGTTTPNQKPIPTFLPIVAKLPTCRRPDRSACEPLRFFSDNADLPKNDPSQLIEFTLGARIDQTRAQGFNPATDPANGLDLTNVDFDVSYVNLAFLPAALGPVDNDQVGYVGTPQQINTFRGVLDTTTNKYKNGLRRFLQDFPGWPRFVRGQQTLLKVPSPLEVLQRLTGANPPADLTPLTAQQSWPDNVWTPIQALRNNWVKFAGTVLPLSSNGTPGDCTATSTKDTFCDAIIDAKKLLMANYKNYRAIFATKCTGTPVTLTDALMISHVYGWSPFGEDASGKTPGCPADANKLQDTPGYFKDVIDPITKKFLYRDYSEYARVKEAFDRLNYDFLKARKYVFNPWVVMVHGANYLGTTNAYAYSVDDAVGNIQADGTGFIIDIGSTKNLENQSPAIPPINVSLGFGGPQKIQFASYRLCVNDPARDKPVKANFSSFVVNANDPSKCPIFLLDNKQPTPQLYTFTIRHPPPFKMYADSSLATWNEETSAPIDCSGNLAKTPGFQPSSATWCCDQTARNGVKAYSFPEPNSAHNSVNHFVDTHIPEQSTAITPPGDVACNIKPPSNGGGSR